MNSFLVAAGACISGGSSKYWCALEASQCPVGTNFITVKKLETTYRNTPAAQCLYEAGRGVPMGQCTMPDDKGICTGNKSNCAGCFETKDECFEPNNGACTLEATETEDGNLNFAVFGFCANPNYQREGICLWSRKECPSTDLWVTPASWLEKTSNVDDFCTCDKVVTGACRYGDDFICAVSEDACDGDEYISAKSLIDMNVDCHLCDTLDLPNDAYPVLKVPQQLQNTQIMASSSLQQPQLQGQEIAHYTVGAGACIAENIDKFWCALDITECLLGTTFVSARELEEKFPNSSALQCLERATSVPLGRCTLPTDNDICTGHKSNCSGCFETKDTCFEPKDESCILEPTTNNDRSLNLALFGLCVNPENPSVRHCLWSRDECPSDQVWITPEAWLPNTPDVEDYCTCDNVLVGACQYGDDFVCAVSENACGEGGKYISAKTLEDMGASFDCHLCESLNILNKMSISPQQQQQQQENDKHTPGQSPQQLKTAAAGACVSGDNHWCALDRTQCPDGSEFLSARMLLAKYVNTPAIKCLDAAGVLPVGQCTLPTDDGLCTGHKSNCQGCYETNGVCFEDNSVACKLKAHTDNDGVAVFGLCVDPTYPEDGHCLWSRDECPNTDMWVTPRRRLENSPEIEDLCTCEKVFIGACQFGNEFVCAVSAEACDNPSEYIGAKQLKEIDPSIDCRLCSSLAKNGNEMSINSESNDVSVLDLRITSKKNPKIMAIVVSILSVICVSLLVATIWKVEKRNKSRFRAAESEGLHIHADGSTLNNISSNFIASTVTSDSHDDNDDMHVIVLDTH